MLISWERLWPSNSNRPAILLVLRHLWNPQMHKFGRFRHAFGSLLSALMLSFSLARLSNSLRANAFACSLLRQARVWVCCLHRTAKHFHFSQLQHPENGFA